MRRRNLAVELLQKLLAGELATRRRKNVVQARSFAEMLEQTIRRYQNRAIEAAQVIEELIGLARELRARRAPAAKPSASPTTSSPSTTRSASTTAPSRCWATTRSAASPASSSRLSEATSPSTGTLRENVRAKLRVLVKRVLRRHGYPPDKQEAATRTVLEQAELLSVGTISA